MTAPKSQNGSFSTRRLVLSASNAPHPAQPAADRGVAPARGLAARGLAARGLAARGLAAPGRAAQREHGFRGVVDVRVAVVVELERPAARVQPRAAHLPVTRARYLFVEQPAGRLAQRWVIGWQARVLERDHGQHGVPDRGLAGFQPPHRPVRAAFGDREPVQPGQPALDHRMVDPVTQQVQRDQRVHPGRLDPAPAAVLLLPGDDPVGAAAQRRPAHRPHRPGPLAEPLEHVQAPVEAAEHQLPAGPVRGLSRLAGRVPWFALGRNPDLVQAEGEGPDRPERTHHGQRHDRLPRPAGPVVNIKREPGRQVDHFGWHHRQVVPGPLAEQGQPDPGEHPGGRDAAAGPDPFRRAGHVRGLG